MIISKIDAVLKEIISDNKELEAFIMLGIICSFSLLLVFGMFTSPLINLWLAI